MNPLQTIKYGTSFPTEKPSNGSLFIRMDLSGGKVYQYDAKNDIYVQIEGIHINITGGTIDSGCVDALFQLVGQISGTFHGGPYYGFKGITTDTRYRYRMYTDWDTSLYTSGYIDPVSYAPTYKVDGHRVTEIQYDSTAGVYKEIVVESSKEANSGYSGGAVGDAVQTFESGVFPLVSSPSSGEGISDVFVKTSGHERYILFNDLTDFGASSLTAEQITIASGGTK